jgi:lysylphosphatidylglycerol synthetase-like protein (DUF2156 family)
MGPLSSSQLLIHNKLVVFSTGLAGLLMIVLNTYVGVECYRTETSANSGKVDRILRLQVFFFDGLMGVYNLSIVLASLVLKFKGEYCLFDQVWRSSVYCSILGVLFSVSSHGSLILIAVMSTVRCIVCSNSFFEIKRRTILIISAVLFVLNLVNSVVPVLPVSAIQSVFRTQALFVNYKDNPFIDSGIVDIDRLDEIHEQYYSTTTDFYKTITDLNKITSKEGLFDVLEIGYYGNNRMCTHNVFKEQASYLPYKISYFIILILILAIVAVTYIIILCKKIQSQRRLRKVGAPADPATVNEISSMKVKIFLMIGTQLLSWVSLIIVACYFHFSKDEPPPLTFEVFALIVIPVNSLLNPIFYSGLYTKIRKYLWGIRERLVEKARRICNPPENSTVELEMEAVDNPAAEGCAKE